MKSEGQVRHQLKQVLFRHLQKRMRLNFRVRPHTCFHNQKLVLSPGHEVGICHRPKHNGQVCDVNWLDGLKQAKECGEWEPLKGKEAVRAEFRDLIESGQQGSIAVEYPDVAALLWVLDAGGVKEALDAAMSQEVTPEEEPAHE